MNAAASRTAPQVTGRGTRTRRQKAGGMLGQAGRADPQAHIAAVAAGAAPADRIQATPSTETAKIQLDGAAAPMFC